MRLYCPECKVVFEDEDLDLCPEDGSRLFTLDTEIEDPLLEATIDHRFRIESLLGRGGMGAVYRGVQLSVGREVAVKVLRNELLDREVALERFYRESKIISGLTHPNIVRLIDFGQDRERDLLYLVMELVEGFNMGDLLEQGRMRASLALEIVYQVCGALTEPHALGVIHRDLKPDNLLLVPISDGTLQVKVLDFGIARALEANTQLTATGMVCGTPQYMAPEQAQNGDLGPPTDLYALGVMLYEMLCGIPPFSGQNSLQIMLQQIQKTPAPLRDYLPPSALPDELEDLVYDMLAKQSDQRPSNAREVRDRIDALRRLYDLDPVRLDPGAERELIFEDWLLAKLPAGGGGEHGHTEALRRETGLGRRAPVGSTHETGEREDLALADTMAEAAATVPLSDQARVRVESDGTRRGSEQARSPSGQRGAGAIGEPGQSASEEPLDDQEIPQRRSPDSTASAESVEPAAARNSETQLEHPDSSTDSGMGRGLIAALVAITGGILVAAAAVVILVISPPNDGPSETDPASTPTAVASEESADSEPPDAAPAPDDEGASSEDEGEGSGAAPSAEVAAPRAQERPGDADDTKDTPPPASDNDEGARAGDDGNKDDTTRARVGASKKERPDDEGGSRPNDDAGSSADEGRARAPVDPPKPPAQDTTPTARDTAEDEGSDARPSPSSATSTAPPPEPDPPQRDSKPTPPRTMGRKDPKKDRPKDEGESDETKKKLKSLFGPNTPKRNPKDTLERTFER